MEMNQDKRNGWSATTEYDMGDSRQLSITTSKDFNGQLTSRASVSTVRDGMRTHVFGLGGGGDFSRVLTKSRERCTEKNVRLQHQEAELSTQTLLQDAAAYYAKHADATA